MAQVNITWILWPFLHTEYMLGCDAETLYLEWGLCLH